MLRPDETAMILEQMRQEIKKNGLADTETKTVVWDGDMEGKLSFPFDPGNGAASFLVRVSENPIALTSETFKKMTISVSDEDIEEIQDVTLVEDGPLLNILSNTGLVLGMILSQDVAEGDGVILAGVYFILYGDGAYIRSLSYEEIHPIPAEYIPPLDRLILNGADGNQYALTITDGAISVAPVTT